MRKVILEQSYNDVGSGHFNFTVCEGPCRPQGLQFFLSEGDAQVSSAAQQLKMRTMAVVSGAGVILSPSNKEKRRTGRQRKRGNKKCHTYMFDAIRLACKFPGANWAEERTNVFVNITDVSDEVASFLEAQRTYGTLIGLFILCRQGLIDGGATRGRNFGSGIKDSFPILS